jgi:ParB/RepB/Spo0J family partition protein
VSLGAIARTFERLPIDVIDEPVLPSRSSMDEEKLDDLVESIRAIGLVQPIAVARVGERYEVLAGHRRRIACGRAGLVHIECMVYPSKDDFLEAVKFAENRHREDLNPADEAIWFSELLEQRCGGDIEKLAAIVGEKVSYLDNRLRLFHGSQPVFNALRRGEIKIGVAHELNKITDPKWNAYYLEHAVKSGASIATVTGWVQQWRDLFSGPAQPVAADTFVSYTGGAPTYDPNLCRVCGKSDPRRMTVEVRVHASCLEAILDPLLEQARGGVALDDLATDPRRI